MVVTKFGSINNGSVYFTAKTQLAFDVMAAGSRLPRVLSCNFFS